MKTPRVEIYSEEDYSILYDDLLPNEKSDDYMLRDEKGNIISSLGQFKTRALYHDTIGYFACSLGVSVERTEHLVKLYKIPMKSRGKPIHKIKKEKKLKPGFIKCVNGIGSFKEHDIRKVGEYYREFYVGEDGKRKISALHRRVMEEYLGRKLEPNERVHHIDGNKENNSIDNLYLFSKTGEHTRIHHSLEKLSYELMKLGIIKFVEGAYCLEETFFDDLERYNMNKKFSTKT